jgi:hypothetical protein
MMTGDLPRPELPQYTCRDALPKSMSLLDPATNFRQFSLIWDCLDAHHKHLGRVNRLNRIDYVLNSRTTYSLVPTCDSAYRNEVKPSYGQRKMISAS